MIIRKNILSMETGASLHPPVFLSFLYFTSSSMSFLPVSRRRHSPTRIDLPFNKNSNHEKRFLLDTNSKGRTQPVRQHSLARPTFCYTLIYITARI